MAIGTIGKKSVILKYFKDRQQTVADFAKELKQLIRDEIDPSRSLGHSDV